MKRHNPELYDQLQAHQFEETDAAEAAFINFMEEVYRLRNDYKILEVGIVAGARVTGQEKLQIFSAHLGTDEHAAALLAVALRDALDRQKQMVLDFLSRKDSE